MTRNRQYFNFCKAIVSSQDSIAGAELYAAEAMSRYIAGMLYALLTAFGLMAFTAAASLAAGRWPILLAPILTVAYGFAIVGILGRYRFMRIKEVELLFAACYRNRAVFAEVHADGHSALSLPSRVGMQTSA
jgi:hypothetical protein